MMGATGMTRRQKCLGLALLAIGIAAGLASIQEDEPAASPETAPAPAAEAPQPVRPSDPMDFVVMEGDGPLGHRIWIQASGRIMPDTALKFVAVSRTQRHRVSMVALDSLGGDAEAAIALGRQLRATRFDTVIGQTRFGADGGPNSATFMAYHAACHAACVYAFAGGVNRTLHNAAVLGFHSLGLPRWAGGTPPPAPLPEEDDIKAQKLAVEIILWLEEAGIDPVVFGVMSTGDEVPGGLGEETARKHRVARFNMEDERARRATSWLRSSRNDEPLLSRRVSLEAPGGRRLDADVTMTCDADLALYMQMRFVAIAASQDESVRLRSAAITFNGTPLSPLTADANGILAVSRAGLILAGQQLGHTVPDMPVAPSVVIAVSPEEGATVTQDITPGLAEALPDFLGKCRAHAEWRP